ncbi:shikimate dehydrogenase family protein [Flagellimonas zhangzhouensis]|uniref:Shikimate dehydrogenase n=1 Tax=Flagellimonas zhangzhouensis TaxID=1073328 RepID=A0A1H2R3P3_9FLAO|nr:shikimate dehydrogenase [Allomuricauda zhangzhouensis]SDQ59179.1 shikimate dehydrogenase [Allomuricauda zhangzhouensis]SDW13760.1 shikimate dehydrogenase [Allomuricauda zhangzhouensis]
MATTGKTNRFGLLGRNISYSFSQGYFTQKFKDLGLENHSYENFDMQSIEEFPQVLKQENLKGLNVTIPYKQEVIPYLDELDSKAAKIGAVNTIQFTQNGLKGFNTDAYGFEISLQPFLKPHHTHALILGTGGASKAVKFVLEEMAIKTTYVSRGPKEGQLTYDQLDQEIMEQNTLIVNCTPLGTFPNIEDKPILPYTFVGSQHLLYDLIYNPEKTAFLKQGEKRGAAICNGLDMLKGQAEKAWEIWNNS